MKKRLVHFCLAASFSMAINSLFAQDSGPPQITKIEPPNWWLGHSINPVRLLIRGSNLTGARVETETAGLKASRMRVNAAGTYLFADLEIGPRVPACKHELRIQSEAGAATAPFEILLPLPAQGRFQGFDSDDVIYLLMPDRFSNGDASNDDPAESKGLLDRKMTRYYHGGDLQGVIDRLPYLQELGVTAIWMNPIYDNVDHLNQREIYDAGPITDYHGYGAVDFYSVEEHLGDVAKLRELVEAAHQRGIKIIQDQVANHSGPYHPWVQDSPTPSWYNGTEADHIANNWQIWTLADPNSPPEVQKPTLDGWFINILPDLNQNDDEAARYIIQNTLWWIGISGLDGIRQDTLPYVPRDFWYRWRRAIDREYPRFTVVGEMWDGSPHLVAFFQGGRTRFDGVDSGIESLFDFPHFYAVRGAFHAPKPNRDIATHFAQDYLYVAPHLLVTFVGLHDVSRFMGEEGSDFEALKLAHTLIFTARGIPLIYYGDEIGLPGGGDPDNRRDFPGGWPQDERNAFDLSGRTDSEEDLHSYLRNLTRVRKDLEPLRRGRTVNLMVEEHAYAFARVSEDDSVVVVFNNSEVGVDLEFEIAPARLTEGTVLQDRLGQASPVQVREGRLQVSLGPRSAAILAE